MLLDVVVVLAIALAIFKGFSRGLIVAVASFFSYLIGLAAALKLSAVVAGALSANTEGSSRWLPLLAFALVFIAVLLTVRLLAKLVQGVAEAAMLGWANRLGGFLFYALTYLFILSILLFYAAQLQVLSIENTTTSVTYPYLKPLGPKIINTLGQLLPFFKNMFTQIGSFFEADNRVKQITYI